VLIAVGYKLAAPKVMLAMWRQGWAQFAPFAITVAAIVFTDLLKGIATGLVAGLFFVVRANRHSALALVHEGQDWMLRFNKDILFIHKQELKRCLRQVPDGARLMINGTAAQVVDRDIYETLEEFETAARYRNITIERHNVAGKERPIALRKGGSRG
jgi:MFS superfamily sulfate permease-like transporter